MTTLRKDIVADLAKFLARDEDKTAPVAPVGPMTELIRGGDVADEITGGFGADIMLGGAGPDVLDGLRGNDALNGDAGADRLIGGRGADTMSGGADADVLFGGAGRDVLIGGKGRDMLTGGAGADSFVFEGGGGRDRITDFEDGVDEIIFAGANGFQGLQIGAHADGVRIAHGGDVAILEGFEVDAIGADDFLF